MELLLKRLVAGGFIVGGVSAQRELPTYNPQTKFLSGQDVVPSFDGWLRNPDGTFTFLCGYFNRNWQEELGIPPGPSNKPEPADADRGQPIYFPPNRQKWVFRAPIPADFA